MDIFLCSLLQWMEAFSPFEFLCPQRRGHMLTCHAFSTARLKVTSSPSIRCIWMTLWLKGDEGRQHHTKSTMSDMQHSKEAAGHPRCFAPAQHCPWKLWCLYPLATATGSQLEQSGRVIQIFFWLCSLQSLFSELPSDCIRIYPLIMYGSPPGSSVLGILQARIPQWVAIPFFRGSARPRNQTQVSCIAGRFFTVWVTREALSSILHSD